MAQLSTEEKIRRIEMAPVEVQTMVAKAFLREDIDDEDVQYLFNTDTIEELNDPNEESNVENINAEEVEGIGAGNFFMRTTKPNGNKNFIRTADGGWNTCIKGYPTDAGANVLANCVGYASGRFKTGSTPRVGAIGCAMKGSTLNGGDGAGHVWIVEKVNSATSTYTSESGYGSTAFWNQTRTNNNGRWGLGSSYTFRAYIYLPDDVQKIVDGNTPSPEPTPQPGPVGKFNIGDKVIISGPLYISSNASSPAGNVSNKVTNITRRVDGSAHPYNTTGDLGWMDESSITKYVEPTPTPTPQPTGLQVGDKVKIIGTGNGSSYGDANTAYGIGWKRQILQIYEGRPFPYRVGNAAGVTTGFYKANALQKL